MTASLTVSGIEALTSAEEVSASISVESDQDVEYVAGCGAVFLNKKGQPEMRPFGDIGSSLAKSGFLPSGDICLICFVINEENGAEIELKECFSVEEVTQSVSEAKNSLKEATTPS